MEDYNMIKACHFRINKGGVLHLHKKLFYWYIPEGVRGQGIKKGDLVLVRDNNLRGISPAIVADLFRAESEEAGKKHKEVIKKLRAKDG